MSERAKTLRKGVLLDLHYGPLDRAEALAQGITNWPGYSKALDAVESELPYDVYYDIQSGEVTDSEPQGYTDEDGNWVEPEWSDWRHFSSREIRRIVLPGT